jgi:aryl-alcohol dehydrogenase-like predicted oxidoreductase
VNEKGLSRKNVRVVDSQLDRLQQEYVDIVFCHSDPLTPTETVVRAMTDIIRGGRATAWGTCDWSAHQITEAYWIAQHLGECRLATVFLIPCNGAVAIAGLEPPTVEQPHYHLLHRRKFETEFFPLYYAPYMLGMCVTLSFVLLRYCICTT